jgi:hypothetical protein
MPQVIILMGFQPSSWYMAPRPWLAPHFSLQLSNAISGPFFQPADQRVRHAEISQGTPLG